jgi:hypothetical protein
MLAVRAGHRDGVDAEAFEGEEEPHATSPPIAAIFRTMNALCTALPARTPHTLIAVRAARAATAVAASPHGGETSTCVYRAKVTATAAIPPVCVTSRFDQPYANPAAGCTPSRR